VTLASKLPWIHAWKSLSGARFPTTGSRFPRLSGRPWIATSQSHPGRASSWASRRGPPPAARASRYREPGTARSTVRISAAQPAPLAFRHRRQAAVLDEIGWYQGTWPLSTPRAGAGADRYEWHACSRSCSCCLRYSAACVGPDSPTGRATGIAQRWPNRSVESRSTTRSTFASETDADLHVPFQRHFIMEPPSDIEQECGSFALASAR
jgi:hypothetical protein